MYFWHTLNVCSNVLKKRKNVSTVYCLEKVSCFSFKIRISILIQIHFCPNFKRTRAICDIWNKALSFSLQCNVNVIIKVTTTFSLAFVDNVVKYSWHRQFRNTLGKKICLFWNILLLCEKQRSFKCDLFLLILTSSFRTKLTFINYCIQCAINLNNTFEPKSEIINNYGEVTNSGVMKSNQIKGMT